MMHFSISSLAAALLLSAIAVPVNAQLSLLGQQAQTTAAPVDPLDRLYKLPLDTALGLLAFAPDSMIYPPAAEKPFLAGVLPEAVKRFMGEPFDEARLRAGLEKGSARYDGAFRAADQELARWTEANRAGLEEWARDYTRLSPPDPRWTRLNELGRERDRLRHARWAGDDRSRWFSALLRDLDAPAPAVPTDTAANLRDIAQLRREMRELVTADRALDQILERVRTLYAEIQTLEKLSPRDAAAEARLAAARLDHRARIDEAEPHKRLRNHLLQHSLDRLADDLSRPNAGLAESGRLAAAPVEALFRLYQMDADIQFKVPLLRAGAQAELRKRAAQAPRPPERES